MSHDKTEVNTLVGVINPLNPSLPISVVIASQLVEIFIWGP